MNSNVDSNVVTIDNVVLTKEALLSIKMFQEDNGATEQQILDEVVDVLLDEEIADKDIKHRLNLIKGVRYISKNIKDLSPGTRKEGNYGNE